MKLSIRLRALSAAVAAAVGLFVVATSASAADLVIAGRDDIYGKGLAEAVAGFKKSHPSADIELLKLPNANLYQKLKLSMREGTGAYDLVMMDDTWSPEFMANGWLKPLPATLVDADMVASTVALGRAPNGNLYALPVVSDVARNADASGRHGHSAHAQERVRRSCAREAIPLVSGSVEGA
nr:extracellular solute-binding protein [Pandoraea oxalativorans]